MLYLDYKYIKKDKDNMKRKRKSYKNTYYNITINNNYYNVEKNTKETEDINNEETDKKEIDNNKKNEISKENKNLNHLLLVNLGAILIFCFVFLLLSIPFNKNNDVKYCLLLTIFSVSFTIATELKDWTEYFIRNKEYKDLNIFVKVIHVMPTFTITLLFLCVFSYFIKFVPNIPDTTANILTILMLIIYSISYTIRTIFYNNDNTKKRKMKN